MIYNTGNPLIMRIGACLAGIFFLFAGCGSKPEPPKPKVFTKKIASSAAASPVSKPSPPLKNTTPAAPLPVEAEARKPEPVVVAKKIPDDQGENAARPVPPAPASTSEASSPSAAPYAYDPKGKIDPFLPWHEGVEAVAKAKEGKRLFLSPLEKVDLSQLTLVGIVLSASGNEALVEDGTGKGFVISKGTYVGLNRGRVARILKDRVIIQEAVQYGASGADVRRKELKLQKPAGEE